MMKECLFEIRELLEAEDHPWQTSKIHKGVVHVRCGDMKCCSLKNVERRKVEPGGASLPECQPEGDRSDKGTKDAFVFLADGKEKTGRDARKPDHSGKHVDFCLVRP